MDATTAPDAEQDPAAFFRTHGYVVLPPVFTPGQIDALRVHFCAELFETIARTGIRATREPDGRRERNDQLSRAFLPRGGNQDLNRWMLNLPSRAPFATDALVANPHILPVVDALLGDDCVLAMLRANTPLPQSGYQTVHQDHATLRLSVNVPLVDVTARNGPTEVWPGTHRALASDEARWAAPRSISGLETLRAQRSREPVALLGPAGSVMIWDERVLHRGTPNRSLESRPMLTLVYAPAPREVPWSPIGRIVSAVQHAAETVATGPLHGAMRPRLLAFANALGTRVEHACGSDRDTRRALPSDTWDALSPRAKRLLRFARIEGVRGPVAPTAPATARASMDLVREGVRLARWFARQAAQE